MFEYVLILLTAILLSNIINRFLPLVSVTIIQILLGAVIALLPLHFHMELDPELFFLLFIAPLVFDNSIHADKEAMWKLKLPIVWMAFGLVFVSTIAGGFMVNLLIPTIPAAAGCALIASLGPTDDVAVFSLLKRTRLPHKLMHILEGESVFNDTAGLISFQFAIAAVITGTFSPVKAAWQFALISIGGILIGLVLTGVKYLLVKWLRTLGLENVTLHILLEILTPFILFIAAESVGCSGIFASFTSGVIHSFAKKRLNPDNVKLNNASESVWSMLSFTLNGIVFLLMGIQLPDIIKTIATGNFPIHTWQVVAYTLLIVLFFIVMRFIWSIFIPKKSYTDGTETVGKLKAGIIISLSGARGAVTLASILSIPLLLDDGTLFPERDLLILISTSVILISLILADFVLPSIIGKEKSQNAYEHEDSASIEILHGVITAIQAQATRENRAAADRITQEYYNRINNLQSQKQLTLSEQEEERAIKIKAIKWEMENTKSIQAAGIISKQTAEQYYEMLENTLSRKKVKQFRGIRHFSRFFIHSKDKRERLEQFRMLRIRNAKFVLNELKKLDEAESGAAVKKLILEYELLISVFESRQIGDVRERNENKATGESMKEILAQCFQLERDGIQAMLENGRISRETAKEMRNNISTLEMKLEEM
jgi:CPA1 family monovalent cation:H+ antiporter